MATSTWSGTVIIGLVAGLRGLLPAGLDSLGRGQDALRASQEALVRQKELTDAIIASSIDGILAFDRDYRFTLWNPSMERILGIPKERVLGRSAFEVFPGLEETGEADYFREVLAGNAVTSPKRPYTVAGTNRHGFLASHYAPLCNEAGQVFGGLAIVHDVTEQA